MRTLKEREQKTKDAKGTVSGSRGHLVAGMHCPLSLPVLSEACLGASVSQSPLSLLDGGPTEEAGQGGGREESSILSHPRAWLPRARFTATHCLAEEREREGACPLIVLSYFAGAADKAGPRENQVGWELLSSWGGGKAIRLEPRSSGSLLSL